MNISFKIIKKLKLDNYLKIVLEKSSSNNAPYHNFYHVMCMVKNCYLIGESEGYLPEAIKNLVIAALFHDFNHSMGKEKDSWNVKEAIKSFKKYSKESEENNKKIIKIIEATEYPYVIEEDQLSLDQKIIRDADLLQVFHDNYIQQNLLGLSQEMKLPITTMLTGQKKFMDSIHYHTDFAQKLSEEKINSKYEDGDYLLSLLKNKS